MAIKGGFLRLVAVACYFIAFCSALVITGSFAWFTLRNQDDHWNIASLVLGAFTTLYALFNTITTCCTAGIAFFAVISILFDIVCMGAMIAVAVINRSATDGCDGMMQTIRVAYEGYVVPSDVACKLYVASFAVAILAAVMFLFAILAQLAIRRRDKREAAESKA